jgi:hypothetical protein
MIAWLSHWYPTLLLFLQCAALGYAFRCMQRGRRYRDEGERWLNAAKSHHDRADDLLTHLMRDHGHLHTPHSHEDSDFAPSVH